MTRTYRMQVRAEKHADTRRRIIEAAAHLQQTVGPQRSTISDIARLAGVERPTVLRHFPDRISLFMACSFGDPSPDTAAWKREPDPEARLLRGLSELYSWFRRNRLMLAHLLEMITADDSEPQWRETLDQQKNASRDALLDGWQMQESARPKLVIALRHAVDYWTWRSLTEAGLSDEQAVEFVADIVRCAAST